MKEWIKNSSAAIWTSRASRSWIGSDETDKGTCPEKEYRKLTELVKRYRKSEDVILPSCQLVPVPSTPERRKR